jgi:peptidoglycan-associated lipoprotein
MSRWLLISCLLPLLAVGACQKKTQVRSKMSTPTQEAKNSSEQVNSPTGENSQREGTSQETTSGASGLRAFSPIYYPFDSVELSEDATTSLVELATFLEKNPAVHVTVSGHADERGTSEYNLALGDERAQVVRTFLTRYGISANRIVAVSYGEELPVRLGDEEDAWSVNRRSEFSLEIR